MKFSKTDKNVEIGMRKIEYLTSILVFYFAILVSHGENLQTRLEDRSVTPTLRLGQRFPVAWILIPSVKLLNERFFVVANIFAGFCQLCFPHRKPKSAHSRKVEKDFQFLFISFLKIYRN